MCAGKTRYVRRLRSLNLHLRQSDSADNMVFFMYSVCKCYHRMSFTEGAWWFGDRVESVLIACVLSAISRRRRLVNVYSLVLVLVHCISQATVPHCNTVHRLCILLACHIHSSIYRESAMILEVWFYGAIMTVADLCQWEKLFSCLGEGRWELEGFVFRRYTVLCFRSVFNIVVFSFSVVCCCCCCVLFVFLLSVFFT